MSTITLLEPTDAQMLDYAMDGDSSMHTSSSDWLAIEASMRDEDHLSTAADYSDTIEVDMEPSYDDEITEFEMMDGDDNLDRDGDAQLEDVEVTGPTRPPSPLIISLAATPDYADQPHTQFHTSLPVENTSSFSPTPSFPGDSDTNISFPMMSDSVNLRPQEAAEVSSTPWVQMTELPIETYDVDTSTDSVDHVPENTAEETEGDVHESQNLPDAHAEPSHAAEPHSTDVMYPPNNLHPASAEITESAGVTSEVPSEEPQLENADSGPDNEPAKAEVIADHEEVYQPDEGTHGGSVGPHEYDQTSASGDPHEISDGVYIDPPPAVLLSLSTSAGQSELCLFNPPNSSGSHSPSEHASSSTSSLSLALQHRPTLYYEPLSSVFDALRQEGAIYTVASFVENELVIEACDLDLRIPEVSQYFGLM